MAYRLRIAAAVFFALLALAFVALWVRSYHWVDNLILQVAESKIGYGSNRGILGAGWMVSPSSSNVSRVQMRSDAVAEYAIDWRDRTKLGFGISFENPDGPYFVNLPHWFLAASSVALAALFAFNRTWRFTSRGLLIGTTVVAAILGLAVYAI